MHPRIVVLLSVGFLGGLGLAACGTPTPTCNAMSCSGCCDQRGQCQVGNTADACGTSGSSCGRCSTGTVCQLGSCFASNTGGGSGGGTGGGTGGGGGGSIGGGLGGGSGGGSPGGGAGGGATGGGGGNAIPCTNDADCGTGRACHPRSRTCAATCASTTDCPTSQRTCATIDNSVARFCQCATDGLCAAAVPGDICNAITRQCSARCTTTGCPSGLTCNTTTGQCGGGTDAGTLCDNSSQPDICGYGNLCDGNNQCDAVEVGTCANVASHPAWSSTSTGPVIYLVVDEPIDDQTKCVGTATPFTVTIYAYTGASPATFPAMKSNLPGFFYYSTSGTANDIPLNFLQQQNYTLYSNDEVMGAKFTLCGAAGLTSLQAGFGFTNGNAVCATLTH